MEKLAKILGAGAERSMAMDEQTWRRHANPWSGWTRMPVLMALTLAIFSNVWIGWWCLAPIAVIIAWTWINPRAFPPPRDMNNWMTHGVMGERVWLNRTRVPIPANHHKALNILLALQLAAAPIWAFGLFASEPWAAFLGAALLTILKIWFVDRCAWLYETMAAEHETYRKWSTP